MSLRREYMCRCSAFAFGLLCRGIDEDLHLWHDVGWDQRLIGLEAVGTNRFSKLLGTDY